MNIRKFKEVIDFLQTDFEMIGFKSGLKTMLKIETNQPFDFNKYKEYKIGVVPGKYRKEGEIYILDGSGDSYDTYLVLKDDIYSEEAIKLEEEFRIGSNSIRPDLILKLGRLLGYPACCSKEYLIKRKILNMEDLYDTYSSIYNMITSYKIMDKRLFRFLKIISHIPCNLGCKDSSIYVDKLFDYMGISKDFRKDLDEFLDCPIIYLREFEMILLNGEFKNNKVEYNGYNVFGKDKIFRDCTLGNKIELINNEILIKNGEKTISTYSQDEYLLINFNNNNFLDFNKGFLEKNKDRIFKLKKKIF
ncbi:MAG: hypothetical protein PHO80_02650 [Candidatus Gracilibacteria bacterium]|nr:hypothetical protein [Candidatus Gracilibacteria bacterium]